MDVTLNLLSVKTKHTPTQTDVITDVNWEICVTKTVNGKDYSASMQLSSGMFESSPEDQFISYEDLSDDQILEWAKRNFVEELLVEFIASLESTVDSQITTNKTRVKLSQ